MSTRVVSYKDRNSFYEYINPWIFQDRKEIKRTDKETFDPIESTRFDKPITSENLLSAPNYGDDHLFHKKWLNKLASNLERSKVLISRFIGVGYDNQEAKSIIDNSINKAEQNKFSASINQSLALTASRYVTATMILGTIYELFAKGETTPGITKTLLKMAHGFCLGRRSHLQYTLYGAHDDDVAQNVYQADIYGNKVAGEFGKFAHTTETKIKPWALPLLGFLPDFWKDNLTKLLTLPDALWWRVRMPAHINQEFLTDLFKFVHHKTLALFGDKKSKKELEEIKERGNLDLNYIVDRHRKNAGLENKKGTSLISHVLKLFQNSFNSDIKVQADASKKFNEFIAPVFGLFSFTSMTLGTVLKNCMGEGGKVFDFISELGKASQHFVYFFRMVIPEFNHVKRIKESLGSVRVLSPAGNPSLPAPPARLEEIKDFYKEKKNFLFVSVAYSASSLLLPFVKLLNFENETLMKLKGLFQEITGDLVNKFFSHRRYLLGKQFEVENPEFY